MTPPIIPPPPGNRSISNSPKVAEVAASSPPVQWATFNKSLTTNVPSPGPKPVSISNSPKAAEVTAASPNQWAKFNESTTSNVSSPGPKPVNFDMQRTAQAVVSDPQILHPVPLRVTPVGKV